MSVTRGPKSCERAGAAITGGRSFGRNIHWHAPVLFLLFFCLRRRKNGRPGYITGEGRLIRQALTEVLFVSQADDF
jgi:hypothetical protein